MKKMSIIDILIITFLIIILVLIPPITAGGPTTGHPYMLFHDISETPGLSVSDNRSMETMERSDYIRVLTVLLPEIFQEILGVMIVSCIAGILPAISGLPTR